MLRFAQDDKFSLVYESKTTNLMTRLREIVLNCRFLHFAAFRSKWRICGNIEVVSNATDYPGAFTMV